MKERTYTTGEIEERHLAAFAPVLAVSGTQTPSESAREPKFLRSWARKF